MSERTPRQFQLEGIEFENTMKTLFKGTEKSSHMFIKPGLKIATPSISGVVAAKTENPQSAQITSSVLKSLTGGEVLGLTDVHGNGLGIKVL